MPYVGGLFGEANAPGGILLPESYPPLSDLAPNHGQTMWLVGVLLIPCSHLCGLGHYRMRGFYTVQTQAEFDAWLAEETALLTAP